MTIADQLLAGNKIFKEISTLVLDGKIKEAYDIIENATPPDEWIIELPSKMNPKEKYKTIKLELMEAVMRTIFGGCGIHEIKTPVVISDYKTGRTCVSIIAIYSYSGLGVGLLSEKLAYGIASSTSDIGLMEISVPKTSSMAVKNAIKNIGGLFGKYLNRETEPELEIPVTLKDEPTPEERATSLTESIAFCKTVNDLKSYRLVVYGKGTSPEIQELYETKLRELKK